MVEDRIVEVELVLQPYPKPWYYSHYQPYREQKTEVGQEVFYIVQSVFFAHNSLKLRCKDTNILVFLLSLHKNNRNVGMILLSFDFEGYDVPREHGVPPK